MGVGSVNSVYPDSVQTSYTRNIADGLPGTPANLNPEHVASFISEEDNGIAFGVVISQGDTAVGTTVGARNGQVNLAATSGYARSTGAVTTLLATWKAITDGSFKVAVDGTLRSITAVNTSAVTSMADVAAAIQARLRVATSSTETVTYTADNGTGYFTITSATTGTSSVVTNIVDNSTGTAIKDKFGFSSYSPKAGYAAVTAAALGIALRSVTVEAQPMPDSGITKIMRGRVGAYIYDGPVKVLCKEATAYRGQVYFNKTSGEIYASSTASTAALGTAKFKGVYSIGEVGVIDITGLR